MEEKSEKNVFFFFQRKTLQYNYYSVEARHKSDIVGKFVLNNRYLLSLS